MSSHNTGAAPRERRGSSVDFRLDGDRSSDKTCYAKSQSARTPLAATMGVGSEPLDSFFERLVGEVGVDFGR